MRTLVAAGALAFALGACRSTPEVTCPFPEALTQAVAGADVVFFGESHDQRLHHEAERDLLACMDDGRPLLLGMEMFQRPYQQPLDDYLAGRIDEREMLRRTEYFTRWGFDHTLYAPIWRWCREHGVRIVPLNCDGATITKIRKGSGIAGLSPEERAQIAEEIDLTNAAHRARVEEQFRKAGHPLSQLWYESMTAWDETMADSAASAIAAAGPGARMLVVAGRGHIEEFTGIPDRLLKRRPGVGRVVIVGETDEKALSVSTKHDGNQWVAVFPEREEPPAVKLSVVFDPKPVPEGLTITSVVAEGSAGRAGILAGDVLAKLGGEPVRDLTDVRYLLDTKKAGEVVEARVIRAGAAVELPVTLAPAPPAPVIPSPK